MQGAVCTFVKNTCRYILFEMCEIFISLITACMRWWFIDRTGRKKKQNISLVYLGLHLNDCSYLLFCDLRRNTRVEKVLRIIHLHSVPNKSETLIWLSFWTWKYSQDTRKLSAILSYSWLLSNVMDTNWYYLGTCSSFIGWLTILCKQ